MTTWNVPALLDEDRLHLLHPFYHPTAAVLPARA